MNRARSHLGIWAIFALCSAVATASEAPRPSQEDRTAIARTRSAYVAAWKASNADTISKLYASDAVVLYPNQPAVIGRAAIREYFAAFFAEFGNQQFELESSEVEIAGSWAFDRGTYRWSASPRAGGQPQVDEGKYLVILQKQADGSWQVARDMDNSDKPLTQATRGTP